MAYFSCKCGEKTYLFGKDGVRRTAEKYNVPLLGELPLEVAVQENSDAGKRELPLCVSLWFFLLILSLSSLSLAIVISDPNSPASQAFKEYWLLFFLLFLLFLNFTKSPVRIAHNVLKQLEQVKSPQSTPAAP